MAVILVILAASSASWSQKQAGWQPAEVEPVKYSQTLAAASTAGHYSSGQQNGRAEFVVSCRQRRLSCADCGNLDRQVREYRFAWIIPPVPDFYFELLRLGAGSNQELASLAVGTQPPAALSSEESVTSDGRWKIELTVEQHALAELARNSGNRAALTLHELDSPGIVTIKTRIPPKNSAFQAVLDACSDAIIDFTRDETACPSLPGEELKKVQVCTLFTHECSEPELVEGGAVWRLDHTGHDPAGSQLHYRLVCEYKKSGSDDDTPGRVTDSGLSLKLTECDETLKPLSVSCR